MYFCSMLNILPSHTTIWLRQALRWPPGIPPLLWIPWPLSVARAGDILLMKRMWQNGVMLLPRLGRDRGFPVSCPLFLSLVDGRSPTGVGGSSLNESQQGSEAADSKVSHLGSTSSLLELWDDCDLWDTLRQRTQLSHIQILIQSNRS